MTVADAPNKLATIAQANDISMAIALPIIEAFTPFYDAALRGVEVAKSITVENADDQAGMKLAHDTRLKIGKVRTGSDKVRKKEKDTYLRMGRAIDGIHSTIAEICEAEENRLFAMETTAIREREERLAAIKAKREAEISPYLGVQIIHYDLMNMPEAAYGELLAGSKLAHEAKVAEAARVEAERVAAEKAKAETAKKLAEENEKLRALAAEEKRKHDAAMQAAADAAAEERRKATEAARLAAVKVEADKRAEADRVRVERENREAIEKRQRQEANEARIKAERAADAERAERLNAEGELALRKQAEQRAVEQKKAAEAAAVNAPDNAKLLALAATLEAVVLPICTGADAKALIEKVRTNMIAVVTKLKGAAK